MDVFRISFYEQFECLAENCSETCCKGFSIPVEEQVYESLCRQGGLKSLKARLCITGARDDRLLNRSRRKCPYLQKDMLCALQVPGVDAQKPNSGSSFSGVSVFGDDRRSALKPTSGNSISGGGVLQPHACRIYPRRRQNFGLLAEETLDLSCPEAARLFLKADFPLTQSHLRAEITYDRSGNNDDEAFFRGLLLSREELICFLCEPAGDNETSADRPEGGADPVPQELSRRFALMLRAAEKIQEKCTQGETDTLARISDLTKENAPDKKLFPLGISIMNEWLNGDIYNEDLLFRMPLLHEVCKLYFKRFDKLNETGGQIRLDELYKTYFKKTGADVTLYAKYAAYYLYRFYTDSYEDYSFVRRIRDMVMHTNLLLLLNALYTDEHGALPEHIATRLLASYEKRAFHSFGLRKSMYKKWADYEEADSSLIEKML